MRTIVLSLALYCSTAFAALACNPQSAVCDDPDAAEQDARASLVKYITIPRQHFGLNENEALGRRFTKALAARGGLRVDVSCLQVLVQTERGNTNAALCMPTACRSLHPTEVVYFTYRPDVTRESLAEMPVYVAENSSDCVRAHIDRFGWKAWWN